MRIQRFPIFCLCSSLRTADTELQSFPSPWNQKNNAQCDISNMRKMPAILAELVFFPLRRRQRSGLPHTARGLPSPECGAGWGGWACGLGRPWPTRHPAGSIPRPAGCRAGEETDDTFALVSLRSWDRHRHRFTCSPLNGQLRDSGQENVTRSLIWAHSEEKGGAETASSLWAWSSVLFIKFSVHFGERGWLCLWSPQTFPALKGAELPVFRYSKIFYNKLCRIEFFSK